MARKKKNPLDAAFDEAFRQHCSNVQFNIMDLGNVHKETLALVAEGKPMDEAIQIIRQKYRQN